MSIGLSKRFEILSRDQFRCRYCGRKAPDARLEVDHIHPRVMGGRDTSENLVTTCYDCNRGKSADQISIPPDSEFITDFFELAVIRDWRHKEAQRQGALQWWKHIEDYERLWHEDERSGLERSFPDDFYEPKHPQIELDFDWRAAVMDIPSPPTPYVCSLQVDEVSACFQSL